ncbi:MAG: metal-dependent hydrolase [Burkholderiales bacterium]
MPTILTHPVVPLAIGLGLGSGIVPPRLLIAGVMASIIPDLDVVSFRLDIPYDSAFGHRGFTHSITFAMALAVCGTFAHRALRASWISASAFLFIATVSHGVLDSFTNGGSGIAFLWPFSDGRFFAPFQVIEVSPIGVARFFTSRGATVFASELLWVWLPGIVLGLLLWSLRVKRNTQTMPPLK